MLKVGGVFVTTEEHKGVSILNMELLAVIFLLKCEFCDNMRCY